MNISEELGKGAGIDSIASWLDEQDHATRLEALYKINGKTQALLYEAAEGRTCTLEDHFFPGREPLQEVIHWGKNSLPMFTKFQKRFCRPKTPTDPLVAYGYNHQVMAPFTGPGYFVAKDAKADDGTARVVVDYFEVPTEKPESWPKIMPNSARLGRFVYFEMRDWMWKISKHVTIGRAKKVDHWMDNWFLLCRED